MPNHTFTVVCDYDGGTYVSQFEACDAAHVAEQWAAMICSQKPIPRSSAHIANRVVRDLGEGFGPVALHGLTNVWQMGAQVGRAFYTATIVQSS
jgi:hypothetical protein